MFRVLPPFGGDQRAVAEIVNGIMNGKTNNTGSVTLATGGALTTTITDPRIGYDSTVVLMPTDDTSSSNYFPYGAFCDTTTQTNPTANVARAMTFNTTDFSEGVVIESNSRMKVSYSGLYNLQFSAQMTRSNSGTDIVSIWLSKNGTNVANSLGDIVMSGGAASSAILPAWNFFINLAKDDYIELMWSAPDTHIQIEYLGARSSPTRPAAPSVIATLSYLSSDGYTSNLYTRPYISSTSKGSAVISHSANYISGKTFKYAIIG